MSSWRLLAEIIGDEDDELGDFVGQAVPAPTEPPWQGRGKLPAGAERIHRSIRTFDGVRGMAWVRRPGDLYDVSLYTPGLTYRDNDDRVLHSSEFEWED